MNETHGQSGREGQRRDLLQSCPGWDGKERQGSLYGDVHLKGQALEMVFPKEGVMSKILRVG